MSTTTQQATVTVALIGNPNTGKSTLFNALAGVRQRVGNYPGVTVEKKIGQMRHGGRAFQLIDLPGTYSVAPRSPDEMVTIDVLLGLRSDVPRPDIVLCIVDGSNLERNLYLLSQVLELGLPTVLVLNMMDVVQQRAIHLDLEALGQRLPVEIVACEAHRGRGLPELRDALLRAEQQPSRDPESPFPVAFQDEVAALGVHFQTACHEPMPRYLVERFLLDSGYLEEHILRDLVIQGRGPALAEEVHAARARLAEAGCPVPAIEAMARYDWVGRILKDVHRRPSQRPRTASDKLDRLLTHRVGGTLIFAALMLLVFQSVFSLAETPMEWIDAGFGALGGFFATTIPEGPLQSLLVNGVIAGVGGVLVFLPQIFILFFFIAILEDCGYMARAAFLMDRLMVGVGLSGKSFIPLLSSFACAIPGIMAARVIENRRDRLTTVMVAPLMSCAARLPVYTLLIAAFIPDRAYAGGWVSLQAITLYSMYLVGILAAVVVALLLKRTLLRGATPPFVMELPGYKIPAFKTVLHRMFERGWAFIRRAGTLIFAVSVLVWAALYFPHNADVVEQPFEARRAALESQLAAAQADGPRRAELEEQLHELDNEIASAYQRQSILGRMGRTVEPVFEPLGWDWRIASATLASFPAREVVVSALGIIYNLGEDYDFEGEDQGHKMHDALRNATWEGTDRPVFNIPVALSIMVFFALCAQCAATLAVIKRETNSWRWPAFTFTYMTLLAYAAAFVTYRVGMMIG
jgi:ferrous iron transport protein B